MGGITLNDNSDPKRLIGAAMVVMGMLALISKLNIAWFRWFNYNLLLSIMLILVGLVLLTKIFILEE